jgi:hypothetical protein
MRNRLAVTTFLALLLIFLSQSAFAAQIKLAWDPPTMNVDDSLLEDLAGYKVYYGSASSQPRNAGFEGIYVGGLAPNWSEYDPDSTGAPSEETTVHGGTKSQKYVATASGRGIYQDVGNLEIGKDYAFSVWVYITARSAVVKGFDETVTSVVSEKDQWIRTIVTGKATAPSNGRGSNLNY